MTNMLFTNVRIIDGSGAPPFAGDVLVQGNRILRVGRGTRSIPTVGATVIDGAGATLMPGMVEAHTHFSWNDSATLEGIQRMPLEEHVLWSADVARRYLEAGFTSCVGAACAKPRLDVVTRNAINEGLIPGPRYLAASQEITVAGGLGATNGGRERVACPLAREALEPLGRSRSRLGALSARERNEQAPSGAFDASVGVRRETREGSSVGVGRLVDAMGHGSGGGSAYVGGRVARKLFESEVAHEDERSRSHGVGDRRALGRTRRERPASDDREPFEGGRRLEHGGKTLTCSRAHANRNVTRKTPKELFGVSRLAFRKRERRDGDAFANAGPRVFGEQRQIAAFHVVVRIVDEVDDHRLGDRQEARRRLEQASAARNCTGRELS
jgi:hypothetical protein